MNRITLSFESDRAGGLDRSLLEKISFELGGYKYASTGQKDVECIRYHPHKNISLYFNSFMPVILVTDYPVHPDCICV